MFRIVPVIFARKITKKYLSTPVVERLPGIAIIYELSNKRSKTRIQVIR